VSWGAYQGHDRPVVLAPMAYLPRVLPAPVKPSPHAAETSVIVRPLLRRRAA